MLVALLALIAFMDLTAELPAVGKGGYEIQHAFLYVLMLVPGHVYEVMPVAALIGTIYTMAQFAASSEFTIMRASSMSTQMAAVDAVQDRRRVRGDHLRVRRADYAAHRAAGRKAQAVSAKGATVSQQFRSGMWTKDVVRRDGVKGAVTGSRFFNVRQFRPDGQLVDVKLYEFDTNFRMRSLITAAKRGLRGRATPGA